ncbi:hypothetical protein BS17DRAFT_770557 [Gyrodon lividus]|nr:hypothetical protein BS17DRAFT_770557 [Gyrodon lividus]
MQNDDYDSPVNRFLQLLTLKPTSVGTFLEVPVKKSKLASAEVLVKKTEEKRAMTIMQPLRQQRYAQPRYHEMTYTSQHTPKHDNGDPGTDQSIVNFHRGLAVVVTRREIP